MLKDAVKSTKPWVGGASPYGAVKGLYAVPCALCIESTHPKRFKEEYAYMHREAECVFRMVEEEGKEMM
jgi:hypothetical protein